MFRQWSVLQKILSYLFYRKTRRAYYYWDTQDMGIPAMPEQVSHYQDVGELSMDDFHAIRGNCSIFEHLFTWINIKRRLIEFVAIRDGGRISATGTIRAWKTHQRRLKWMGNPGAILGPYWTRPEDRGKGLYPKLLLASVTISGQKGYRYAYVFAHVDNVASRRGIEKAGFQAMGCYEIIDVLFGLFHWRYPLKDYPDYIRTTK